MTGRRLFTLALLLGLALAAPASRASVRMGSKLALPVSTAPGEGLLAQRVIDREWGFSEDSTYRDVDVSGWKSEGGAMALSAIVPGAGHLYTGEASGWAYLLLETAGWVEQRIAVRTADRRDDEARSFVGDPYDTTSGWSIARFHATGGGNTDYLERLWAGDREAYYRLLASDPDYVGGFAGADPTVALSQFVDLRAERDSKLRLSRHVEVLLWLNHVVSAVDALRAARIHNLPLRQQYQLQFGQRLRHGRPELRAAVVRRF
jgi:hypothetical protein